MKTINLKNTFKVFIFSLLLCSTMSYSASKIPTEASSSGYESKYGCAGKVNNKSKLTAKVYSKHTRTLAMKTKSKKSFLK